MKRSYFQFPTTDAYDVIFICSAHPMSHSIPAVISIMNAHCVDLTVSRTHSQFSDDEDAMAFGNNQSDRILYRQKIRKFKKNDPNLRILDLRGRPLTGDMCERVGIYLWSSKYIKNILLQNGHLTPDKMENLFGKIARQNESNVFVLKEGILDSRVAYEKTLVNSIIESVTSFINLVNVNVSWNNIGENGLDVLVKALSDAPINNLDISHCDIERIAPLKRARKFKVLKKLDLSGNRIGVDDFETVLILMDNGYPKLKQLDLQSCGISDDLIELFSPVLTRNKSLSHLHLHNYQSGERNLVGERGAMALCRVLHDSSSITKTLASNHTVMKMPIEGAFAERLLRICMINYRGGHASSVGPFIPAWTKHIAHLAANDAADMSPFMEMDIKLIPRLLARIQHRYFPSSHFAMSAYYKIWSCNMFRDRVGMASQIDDLITQNNLLNARVQVEKKRSNELEDDKSKLMAENAKLQQQEVKLFMDKETKSRPKSMKREAANVSIADRVKMRKSTRSKGR